MTAILPLAALPPAYAVPAIAAPAAPANAFAALIAPPATAVGLADPAQKMPRLAASPPAKVADTEISGGGASPVAATFDDVDPPAAKVLLGFGELGMFGRFSARFSHAGAPLPGTQENSPRPGKEAPPSLALLGRERMSAPLATSIAAPAQALAPQTLAVQTPGDIEDSAAMSAGVGAPSGAAMIAPESGVLLAPAGGEALVPCAAEGGGEPVLSGPGGAAKMPLRAPPPAASANPVNLVVGGEDAALAIVARGEPGADYATLRARIADVAAEFGMDVADFQLNGFAPSFKIQSGGSRGGRTS